MLWSETAFKLRRSGFEEGLSDACRRKVDQVVYHIDQEYRSGVEIAQQLMARFDTVPNEMLNGPLERPSITARSSQDHCNNQTPTPAPSDKFGVEELEK